MVERQNGKIKEEIPVITILGPTASGKTSKAVGLARVWNAEILSADSRQVYRKMNLGTGKDLEEYGEIPFHLIDICEAGEKYNLHRYIKDFREALKNVREKGKNCIICGGSGMYLENAISDIDLPDVPVNQELRKKLEGKSLDELAQLLAQQKTLHNTTDIDTAKRAIRALEIALYYKDNPSLAQKTDRKAVSPLDSLIVGLEIPREERIRRIDTRLQQRLEAGMLDEVREIVDSGVAPEDLIYYGLEYKYLTLHLLGEISYDEMFSQLSIAIHQFAKRQMTWFRGMERRGFKINWVDYNLSQEDFNSFVLGLYHQTFN